MDCCNKERNVTPIGFIPPFAGFTEFTASIPKMYFDVKSQEQRILAICKMLDKLICYADLLGDQVNINTEDIAKLKADFLKFMESGFDDYYANQVEKWVNENLHYIFDKVVKQVYFGLTDDGHFVAYIPDGWDDIMFDTGYDYDLDTYGRLILRWNVDSAYNVNQTPEDNSEGIE